MKLKNYYDTGFISSKHLDIGCGFKIKNPYNAPQIFGIDIHNNDNDQIENYKKANLVTEGIPFPDNFFSSVSAYDFIEHIPRQLLIDKKLEFPFINLMNEIYRVLEPNGLFFALTPFYPSAEAFVDPTHVNFITDSTHKYFTHQTDFGSHYGFNGNFKEKRILKMHRKYLEKDFNNSFIMHLKWLGIRLKRKYSHLAWELEAIKN